MAVEKKLSMSVDRFEDITDPLLHGGKSYQLGAAIRAGLPVPPGFGISCEAVEAVVRAEPATCRGVVAALQDLAADSVAVRSSAIGEDSSDASFAGHHLSLMHLRSPEAILDGIRQVWQSGCDPGALAYRQKKGIAGPVRIGVAVQAMVDADCSGVLFSRHPVTGADEMVIEASWGLGEGVVSGLVIPDHYRVSRTGEIVETRLGEKDVAIQLRVDGGTEERPVEQARATVLCLSNDQIDDLRRLAIRCEALFPQGLDIEWAYRGGELFLLQCRPISTK